MRISDRGRLGHEDHVAQQGHGSPQPHGRSVQGADDGQVDVEQVPDHLLAVQAQVLEALRILQSREPSEVAPRRERPPGAREQNGPGLALVLERGEQGGELGVQKIIHRVEVAVATVEHHPQHRPLALEADGPELPVVHIWLLSVGSPRARRPSGS